MRITSSILLILLPLSVSAFDLQNMDQGDMQKMMENMQKMQSCMSNINQDELNKLKERSEKFATSIKPLCKKGLRAEAQEKAISYSKQFVNDPTMNKMKKCGEMAKGMMPEASFTFTEEQVQQGKDKHVCDSLEGL